MTVLNRSIAITVYEKNVVRQEFDSPRLHQVYISKRTSIQLVKTSNDCYEP